MASVTYRTANGADLAASARRLGRTSLWLLLAPLLLLFVPQTVQAFPLVRGLMLLCVPIGLGVALLAVRTGIQASRAASAARMQAFQQQIATLRGSSSMPSSAGQALRR